MTRTAAREIHERPFWVGNGPFHRPTAKRDPGPLAIVNGGLQASGTCASWMKRVGGFFRIEAIVSVSRARVMAT